MAHGTCSIEDCDRTGRLKRGLCSGCYQWSQKNPGKDPTGRMRLGSAPDDGQCTVIENGAKCTKAHAARGMCNMHHLRNKVHGDPLTTVTRPNGVLDNDLQAAAHATTDECVFLDGYASRPSVRVQGVMSFASRVVWTIRHGDPGEANVLHNCNGGSGASGCINIRHLYLGTKSRNVQDAVEAGRMTHPGLRGQKSTTAVLTEAQVRTIRERWAAGGVTQKAMAAEYGVSRATVCLAISGKNWAHLD